GVLVTLAEDGARTEDGLPDLRIPDLVQDLHGIRGLEPHWVRVSLSPYALLDVRVLLLGHRDRAHRAAAPLSLRQARIVHAITGTTLDAYRASGARVVVDHEDGERALGLVPDGLGLGVLHDPRIEHVDAVPWADVLARATQDARFGVEHEVLRR